MKIINLTILLLIVFFEFSIVKSTSEECQQCDTFYAVDCYRKMMECDCFKLYGDCLKEFQYNSSISCFDLRFPDDSFYIDCTNRKCSNCQIKLLK